MQINDVKQPYELLESNLKNLSASLPDVPVTGILLTRLILLISRDLASMLDARIRPCGLGEAEFRVLSTLFSQPESSAYPSDLCARMSHSAANISRICDSLVEQGLITRVASAHDRRRMVLRLTPQGRRLVMKLLPTVFEPLRDCLTGFTETEQRQMVAQLKQLGAAVQRLHSP